MDSNGHNGIKGLRVLLSGPAADGVATMLAHQPAISLVRPTGLAETQTSADVALHVLESSSVHGELPHARELRVPLILAAYGEPNGCRDGLAVGAADARVTAASGTLVAAFVARRGWRRRTATGAGRHVFSPKAGRRQCCDNLAGGFARSGVDAADDLISSRTQNHPRCRRRRRCRPRCVASDIDPKSQAAFSARIRGPVYRCCHAQRPEEADPLRPARHPRGRA
jgi:hypothetical protein